MPNIADSGFKIVDRLHVLSAEMAPHARAKSAELLVGIVKKTLSKRGTGRVYNLTNPNRRHVASAPGEPPAVDLGDLRRSIGSERVGKTIRVGTNLQRAAALEYGHVYGSGRVLAPRPFMRPSAEELKRHTKDVVSDLRVRGRRVLRAD